MDDRLTAILRPEDRKNLDYLRSQLNLRTDGDATRRCLRLVADLVHAQEQGFNLTLTREGIRTRVVLI